MIQTLVFVLILHGFANDNGVNAGATPAIVLTPNVISPLGKEARLSCSISKDGTSLPTEMNKLRFCVWERLNQDKGANAFIVNFNEINSQPGLYSGVRGYSYIGEGFAEGECGVKVSFVKPEDFARWQCTLITDNKVYRGYVTLEKETPPTTTTTTTMKPNQTLAVASSFISVDNDDDNDNEPSGNGYGEGGSNELSNRPRPIITSYNDARAIIQPEIIIHSTSPDGTRLIQEVKVESAGLKIKPRRQGKLIVFERK